MMPHKRGPISLNQRSFVELMSKRVKADVPPLSSKEKEKFSERIYALQQLVSPYGKTDTASVLEEAMGYIRFLHEQVKVLSAPYLYSTAMLSEDDFEPWSLKAKGLCLVPVSLTIGVASSNGADIWAPVKDQQPSVHRTAIRLRQSSHHNQELNVHQRG